ncbi:MAG: glucose 1-dehydrogenase [Candidatus Omnitrophica bacterium]|nr:glucose 1-dehydrogenase [Candidatus Omnitrophota bacterium]MBD3269744.1 glucose 1-dehydrogenase [Candidatus Omnitrophota bacterium]
MARLKEKVVIITGSSRGIGKGTARVLAEEGAKVAITDVLDEEGNNLAKEIKDSGGEADYWHLDVADVENVSQVFREVNDKFGAINVLVNNAGISGANKPTHQLSEEEWDKVMAINVKGVFLCTKQAISYMESAGEGSIINLSSIYGIIGAPDIPPYHASKGAVRLMTKTDALLYASKNIRVNSIHPGFIWTPLVENMAKESEGGIEKFRETLNSMHPVGHVGEPEDIAYGVLYLASSESKFITGSELVIDGGYTAK